jgi:hypothetical protein
MDKTLQTTAAGPREAAAPNRGSERLDLRDTLLGAIGAGLVIFAVVLLFLGGERDTGAGAVNAPVLNMVQPAAGAVIQGPLHVVFRLNRELERLPTGWGVGDLHLHLGINGREYMPGARDIEPLQDGLYRWTLSGLPAGEHELRLFWAGADHRAMASGASIPVRVRAH